jgi:hypothetical protein
MSQGELYDCMERFKQEHMSFDDARSGRPLAITCVEVKERIDKRIRENRRITDYEIMCEMSISHVQKRCNNDLYIPN